MVAYDTHRAIGVPFYSLSTGALGKLEPPAVSDETLPAVESARA